MFRLLLILLFSLSTAQASDFRIIVPTPNDGYGIAARILSRHYGKYLDDNPKVILQAKPGAAGMVAANYIYSVAPNNGSVMATVQKDIIVESIISGKIDPSKFTWIGSTADGRKDAIFVWSNKPYEILHYRNHELITSADGYDEQELIRKSLNLKIRPVTGYSSGGEIRLAIERKELDAGLFALIGIKTTKPDWLKSDSKVKPILQYGNGKTRHPDFLEVPTLSELVTDPQILSVIETYERQYILLRPFIAPPNVPLKRAQELRDAFFKTMQDAEYLKEMRAANIDVHPVFWKEAELIVNEVMRTYKK
jgi:tripartite-type tricarboxylate transporter receptor subunit TctC